MKKAFLVCALFFAFTSPGSASTILDIIGRDNIRVNSTEPKITLMQEAVKENRPESFADRFENVVEQTRKGILILRESGRLTKGICNALSNGETADFCGRQFLIQKITLVEKKHIADRRAKWNLTKEYCFRRTTYENYMHCENQLREQQVKCEEQVTNGKRIIIDLENQLLYGLIDCQLKVYSRVTTGKNSTPSPTGKYKVYEERGPHWMQGEWFVTKALYFHGGYAIHDAGWRVSPYWKPENRSVYGSHGCINTPKQAMQTVWDTFGKGDAVEIYRTLPDDVRAELEQKVGSLSPVDPERKTVVADSR